MEPSKGMQHMSPKVSALGENKAVGDLEAGIACATDCSRADLEGQSPAGDSLSPNPNYSPCKIARRGPLVRPTPSNTTSKSKPKGKPILASILQVIKPFFVGPRAAKRSVVLATSLFVLLCLDSAVMIWFSYIQRKYMSALTEKDEAGFYHQMKMTLAVILIILPLISLGEFLKGVIQIEWRRHMTQGLLGGYLTDTRAFYTLKNEGEGSSIDNPDQRITQDAGDFTAGCVTLFTAVVFALITLASGSTILAVISPKLLCFVFAYSLVGTVVMLRVFGMPLTRLQRRVLEQEATLRFALVRVRESAEAIAFLQGEEFEARRCKEFFHLTLKTWYKKLTVLVGAMGFKRGYTLITYVLPGLMVGPAYLRGEIDFGAIMQVQFLFASLLEAMMTLVSHLDLISNLGAQAVRLQQLMDKIEELKGAEADKGDGFEQIALEELPDTPVAAFDEEAGHAALRLQVEKVSLAPPMLVESDERPVPLMRGINLELHDGESLLICGGSGLGKSSLLRAIGGLWRSGSGSVQRCRADRCFFAPQRPYMCLGTLREQVNYPSSQADDEEILSALREVNLGYVVDRHGLDMKADFSSVLSLGEQQRLGFARLLLRKDVHLALVDEGTSALDEENEALLYRLLRKNVRCFVSVGHRPQLHQFHTHKLKLYRSPQGGSCGQVMPIGEPANTAGGTSVGI